MPPNLYARDMKALVSWQNKNVVLQLILAQPPRLPLVYKEGIALCTSTACFTNGLGVASVSYYEFIIQSP